MKRPRLPAYRRQKQKKRADQAFVVCHPYGLVGSRSQLQSRFAGGVQWQPEVREMIDDAIRRLHGTPDQEPSPASN